jgi:hypothetical protein
VSRLNVNLAISKKIVYNKYIKRNGVIKMLKNYLFIDEISGEEFICQAADLKTAEEILELEGFDLLHIGFVYELTDYEAENSGLDVY